MPHPSSSQSKKPSCLRDYLGTRESVELFRLGLTVRNAPSHRQKGLIAILDDSMSVLQQQAPHDGHALMGGRDLAELGKPSSVMLAILPTLTGHSIHRGTI